MEKIRIKKLEIEQIGPFGSLVLEFPEKPATAAGKAEIHILTGENGTGKSTVLEAIAMSLDNARQANLIVKARGHSAATTLFLNNSESINSKTGIGRMQTVQGSQWINEGYWKPWGNLSEPFQIAFFAYSGHRQLGQAGISGIQEIQSHPLDNALSFVNAINPHIILQWIGNTIAAEAIAKSQGEENESISRRDAISRLEKAISKIIEKPIRFLLETKPYNVRIEVDGEKLDFNQLPDGLKSIVSWLADLLMRMDRVKWVDDIPVLERPFILFLDEIEVHMHPAWQRKILPAVQGLFPNAQIFISTHSPFVVGSVDGAWIHKLVKPNGDSKLAAGYPMLSEDAKSYRYWLEEVFDVAANYGPEAEKELKKFYELRDATLKGESGIEQKLLEKGRKLAKQSHEMHQIIELEIRQVNRRRSLELSL